MHFDIQQMYRHTLKLRAWSRFGFPDKIQGDNNLFKTIEDNKELSAFLIDYFKEQINAWSLLTHMANREI